MLAAGAWRWTAPTQPVYRDAAGHQIRKVTPAERFSTIAGKRRGGGFGGMALKHASATRIPAGGRLSTRPNLNHRRQRNNRCEGGRLPALTHHRKATGQSGRHDPAALEKRYDGRSDCGDRRLGQYLLHLNLQSNVWQLSAATEPSPSSPERQTGFSGDGGPARGASINV